MASKNKMEKCKDHTQEKHDSGECCQVVEKAKAEQQGLKERLENGGIAKTLVQVKKSCE